MQPTKEQWAELIDKLTRIFGEVYLRCDGYLVLARRCRISKNRLGIEVWIDGMFKGAWITREPMCEEARRFFRPISKSKYSAAFIHGMEKAIGKRRCKADDYYEHYVWPLPYWTDAKAFARHVKKHNEQIEILNYPDYAAALAALPKEEVANA